MIRKSRRIRLRKQRSLRWDLRLENLEDRRLMAADFGASATADAARILIGYQGQQTAVVRQVNTTSQSLDATLSALRADPTVRYAEVDYRVEAAVVPNDPRYSETWGLHSSTDIDIDAPEAWDMLTGSMKTVVAVIDSGIDYLHQDLYQNIWLNQGEIPTAVRSALVDIDNDSLITFRDLNDIRNQGQGKITDLNSNGRIDGGDLLNGYRTDGLGGWADGTSNDGDKYVDDLVGWNFVNNTNNPFDDNGHGTHVAGTIGAKANNSLGVAGVLWNVQLVGLKFMDATGGGYVSDAVAAVNYAVSKSIPISNNSWGGGGYSQAMYDAINNGRAKGHIFVAAAGNGGSDGVGDNNNTVANYPANYNLDNVIAVAATDRYDRLAGFSNYGSTTVDIAAPGVGILSTVPGGGYASYSGTSMASPHVAGVAALVLSQNPTWSYSQVVNQVLNSGDLVSGLSGKVVTGARLNAAKAVSATSATPVAPAPVVTGPHIVSAKPNFATNGGVNGVRVTFSEPINPSTFTTADITSFTGPSGSMSVSKVVAVSGSNNTQFDVRFSTRTAAGNYTLNIGPNVADSSGILMDQDKDGVVAESLQDRFTAQFTVNPTYSYSSTPYAAIRDGYATPVSINVDKDFTITDLNVKVNVTHGYDGDLVMYLTGPDGTSVDLVVFRGGSGDNFKNTWFSDEASASIATGAAPFSGSYRPEQSLTAFDGKNARGTWTLWVEDWYQGYTGTLNSVSLSFASASWPTTATAGTALSHPGLISVQSFDLPNSFEADIAKLQQAVSDVAKSVKKDQLVDALFGALAQRREKLESVRDDFREVKQSLTQQDDFSWGAAVDKFMGLFAGK